MPDGALGAFLTILGILAAVSVAVSYVLGLVQRERRSTLRANNEDLLQRVDVLEKENASLKGIVAAQQAQINALQETVRGAPEVLQLRKEILDLFQRHEAEAHERAQHLIESQDRVAEAIGQFTRAVRDAQR